MKKIKGSSHSLGIMTQLVALIAMLIVSAVLRCIQVKNNIDAETGFYFDDSHPAVYLLIVLVIAGAALFYVFAYVSEEANTITPVGLKSKPLSAASVALAAAMIFDALNSSATAADNGIQSSETYFDELGSVQSGLGANSFFNNAVIIFAVLGAVYLLILASSFFSGNQKAAKHRLLALTPAVWMGFRLMGMFVVKISFLRVSDLFLNIFTMCFSISFFVALAMTISGVYSSGNSWKLSACGYTTAFLAFTANIARLIFTFVDKSKYVCPDYAFSVVDVLVGVFAVVLLVECAKKKSNFDPNEVQDFNDDIVVDIEDVQM